MGSSPIGVTTTEDAHARRFDDRDRAVEVSAHGGDGRNDPSGHVGRRHRVRQTSHDDARMRTRREPQRVREIQVTGHDDRRGLSRPCGDRIVWGAPEAEILAEYDLTTDQLRAVFRYAAWLASQQSLRAS